VPGPTGSAPAICERAADPRASARGGRAQPGLRDEIGEDLFRHILRDQLRVTEEQFWAIVRGGDTLPDTPRAVAATVPAWLVERLLFTVGLSEDEIRAMTADEARTAWDAYRVKPQ